MENIKKILLLIIAIFLLTSCGVKTWKYDLPNNYQIRKYKNALVKIGYVKNNKFYTKLDDQQIGIDDYVFEYQTSNNFIGAKTLKKNTLEVNYYIIDTNVKDLYGPYTDYDVYKEVLNRIAKDEKFNEFIKISDYEK